MRSSIILLFVCFSITACAQSKTDYQRVMDKFVKCYNQKQGTAIVNMWDTKLRRSVERLWTTSQLDTLQLKYGKISSAKLDSLAKTNYGMAAFFTTKFSKLKPNGATFILDKSSNFEAFQLFTSEPKYIDAGKKSK